MTTLPTHRYLYVAIVAIIPSLFFYFSQTRELRFTHIGLDIVYDVIRIRCKHPGIDSMYSSSTLALSVIFLFPITMINSEIVNEYQ
jgi:hypothetical protein